MADIIAGTGSVLKLTKSSNSHVATVARPNGTEEPVRPSGVLPTDSAGTYTVKVRDPALGTVTVTISGDNARPSPFNRSGPQRVWVDYEVRDGFEA